MQLSTNGNKLFTVIYTLQKNNKVYLHFSRVKPLTNLSLEQFVEAVKELNQKKVIKPTFNDFEYKLIIGESTMQPVQLGSYVSYKNKTYIVSAINGTKLMIVSPTANTLQVGIKSVEVLNHEPAKIVSYRDANYLITSKGLIISLTTNKIMKWNETDGNRIAILNELNQEQIGI